MQIVRTIRGMQALAWRWQAEKRLTALVPTMGALHEGHLSLLRAARAWVGRKGTVVASIYVNPTQFGPKEDFQKYPRPFTRDCKLCMVEDVDVVFAPRDVEMYADGFSASVEETRLAQRFDGAARPGHFRGVCTVVAKLFNIVQPDVAMFGEKDYQQALVIRQMVHNLNFPLDVVVCPTVREMDGLAMSSRNAYLSPDERLAAVVLKQALDAAQATVRRGERSADKLRLLMRELIASKPQARVDYIEMADAATLEPLHVIKLGKTVVLLAVFIGRTRLIDNAILK